MSISPQEVQKLVDHLFREHSGKMVFTLTRVFGTEYLDLAESVVQDALIKAMQVWPIQGVPENPTGWLVQVSKNLALDVLRRERFQVDIQIDINEKQTQLLDSLVSYESDVSSAIDAGFQSVLKDDQLRMIFVCCHPVLSREARIALTLKTLCGFSVGEIARAFLSKPDTVDQRLVRAKNKIKEERIPFQIPEKNDLLTRLDSVLEVFYLLFNEGYSATEGDELIRRDLCEDAIRLTTMIVSSTLTQTPKGHALLALMYFQSSRVDSRIDTQGELLLLSEQDR